MFKTGFRKKEQEKAVGLRSSLLPLLFEHLDEGRRLVVLDVGPASPSTVKFFTQFKCRLNFANLYTEDFVSDSKDDATYEELVEQFRAGLRLPDKTVIDLCLFWDFFNYLDGQALKAFIEALSPYIKKDTRGYAVGVLNARTPLPNYLYGIDNVNQLNQSSGSNEQLKVFPHSQRDLNEYLNYFFIDKSRLIADGRVEYLLMENRGRKKTTQPIFGM